VNKGEGRKKIMKAKLVSLALLAIMTLSAIAVIKPAAFAQPPLADSMWITCSSPTAAVNSTLPHPAIDGSKIGYHKLFNITVWLNMTDATNAWQFMMVYNNTQMKWTGKAWYSRPDHSQSQWSYPLPIVTGASPSSGSNASGYSYVLWTEVLASSANKTGYGSLAIVQFNVTASPLKYQTIASTIRLDQKWGPVYGYALDSAGHEIPLTFDYAKYKWLWTPPPKATFLITPGTETFGGTPIPLVLPYQFTETVQLNVDAGWGCINASFKLTNDNTTLLIVSKVVKGGLWTGFKYTAYPGYVLVNVSSPSPPPPSGVVDLATITYNITSQGYQPHDYVANLALDNSTGLVYAWDKPDAKIPVNLPLPTAKITVGGIVTKFPGALQVSTVHLGPNPVRGQLFNVTVKIVNLHSYWCLIGLDFRLAINTSLISFVSIPPVGAYEGPFLPYYSLDSAPNSWPPGTWFDAQFWPADLVFPDDVLVGNLIFPNTTGWWPTRTSLYPDSNATDSTVAILTFRVEYQSYGEVNITSPLNIIQQHWVGIDPATMNTTQDLVYDPFGPPRNGTLTITTRWPGRVIDLFGGAVNSGWGPLIYPTLDTTGTVTGPYPQFPSFYGGQGPDTPMDMVEPQSWVYLHALVTYNYWPIQHKLVTFEIEEPDGVTIYNRLTAFTDANGVASVGFRMPWPCTNPESLFGVWEVSASCQVADVVITDDMSFHYDYLIHIWGVSTDAFQYNHLDWVKITVDYGSHAQQVYPVCFFVSIVDNLNVTIGVVEVDTTVGGTVFSQYKNDEFTVSIQIPKWAYAGLATVHVNAIDMEETEIEAAVTPEYVGPTIAIQPY
jgi:hypothetical protein